jgi:hypothetical protein
MTISRTGSAGATPRGRRRWAGLALTVVPAAALLATAVLVAGSASADTTNYTGPIFGYGGLCLDDRGASTADFNPVQVFTCNGTAAQTWTAVAAGSTLQALGKCLDVSGGGTADGTAVDLYDCNGTGAQVWIPTSTGALYNPQSNKCLDDTGWSTTAGTQVQISDCTGGANQLWNGNGNRVPG